MNTNHPISEFLSEFQLNLNFRLRENSKTCLKQGKDHMVLKFDQGARTINVLSGTLFAPRYPNSEFGEKQNKRILDIIEQEVLGLGFTMELKYENVTTWNFTKNFPFVEMVHTERPNKAIISFK